MFPKPIASTASAVEVLSASVPEESYTGSHYLNITPSVVDAGNTEEWQRSSDGGATWGSILTRAGALAITYDQTARWRVRIYNSNFGSTGSWFTLAAPTVTRQGPASAPIYPTTNITLGLLAFDGGEGELESTVLMTDNFAPGFSTFHNTATLYSKQIRVTMVYNNPSLTSTTGTANTWVDFSGVGVDTNLTNSIYFRTIDNTLPSLLAGINLPIGGTPTPSSITLEFKGGYIDGDFDVVGRYASYQLTRS